LTTQNPKKPKKKRKEKKKALFLVVAVGRVSSVFVSRFCAHALFARSIARSGGSSRSPRMCDFLHPQSLLSMGSPQFLNSDLLLLMGFRH
jgi:hypothetical protein